MPTIFVSRKGGSKNLRLRDSQGHNPNSANIETKVKPGVTVKWKLDPRAAEPSPVPGYHPIAEILEVVPSLPTKTEYLHSVQVLNSDPQSNGGIWEAKVKLRSPGRGKYMNYKIKYKLLDGTIHTEDPKLVMNS